MPSKKRATRAAQLQAPPAQSDYDTDTANLTDTQAQAPPNIAPPLARTNTELNLTVLRRYCPEIDNIVSIAPFAVIYLFSPETQQWEKCGIEGTLFVCSLTAGRYNVVMLNRKSLDNFITELLSAEDIEITEEYVILQVVGEDGTPQIFGLWIFSDSDARPTTREMVAYAIQECAMKAEQRRRTADGQTDEVENYPYGLDGAGDTQEEPYPTPQPQPEPAGKQLDLLQLFNKPRVHSEAAVPVAAHPHHEQETTRHPSHQLNGSVPPADLVSVEHTQNPTAFQQQTAPPPTQRNALLDLFKSAERG